MRISTDYLNAIGVNIVTILISICCATAQSVPTFDVSSVKPSKGISQGVIHRMDVGTISVSSMTLSEMIQLFYSVKQLQVIGGPSWVRSERYDITGKDSTLTKYPEKATANDGHKKMRALLEDRFHLALHHETREMPALALQVNKKKNFIDAPCAKEYRLQHGLVKGAIRISSLVALLKSELETPVIDETNLNACYEFNATWAIDPNNVSDPSVITAMHDIGFRLKRSRARVDVLVIDKAEHPSPD
jgi:uncharacterized protein (TIGR03435 family)